ncbi:ion transporter [Saccharopolyspora gloriosae]|uniref:ion transporter n=1 Tax=Saccharopolyspora gloriosae TaxID=455344 RepID=UPI001FB5B30B|nr:ion transporter [Saccharopolyspora gloriosae]
MSVRERVENVVEAPRFHAFIIGLIVVNAITLGLETVPHLLARYGALLHTIDRTAMTIFVGELLARLYVHRLRFFRDPWNCFDLLVVGVALAPASGPFGVLRALRVLRVLRLISVVPTMRRVVTALLAALPGMASIGALLALILYVSAVLATTLYRDVAPEYFGHLGDSLFTLFQVMTGEAWSDVAREVMAERPISWIFFVVYIAVTTFTVLNLFIAVAVSAMETQVGQEDRQRVEDEHATMAALLAEVQQLRTDMRELREDSAQPAGKS